MISCVTFDKPFGSSISGTGSGFMSSAVSSGVSSTTLSTSSTERRAAFFESHFVGGFS